VFTARYVLHSTFCPHSVFMCFVWISEQIAIISLYNINWLVGFYNRDGVFTARYVLHYRFCPHSVFMCFVLIWEQTAIISLYSINWSIKKYINLVVHKVTTRPSRSNTINSTLSSSCLNAKQNVVVAYLLNNIWTHYLPNMKQGCYLLHQNVQTMQLNCRV